MIYRTLFTNPGRRYGSAFTDAEEMRHRMAQLLSAFSDQPAARAAAGVFPAINISEDPKAYFISAELPGVKSEDLDLNVTANQLTLAGERRIVQEEENVRYHRREREAGRFSRAIALPDDVDTDGVKAKLTDGVLTITIPKAEAVKPKKISVL